MNPLGGLLAILGIVIMAIAVKGSQHEALAALASARPSAMTGGATGTAPTMPPVLARAGRRPVGVVST